MQQSKKLNLTHLASLPEDDQKRIVGQALFPMVQNMTAQMGVGELDGKVTGMMLDMDIGELISMMENPIALEESVKEALKALEEEE